MKRLMVFGVEFSQQMHPATRERETGLTLSVGLTSLKIARDGHGNIGLTPGPDDVLSFFGSTADLRNMAMCIMEQCDKVEDAFGTGKIVVPPPGTQVPPLKIQR